jgi:hypothetical protein
MSSATLRELLYGKGSHANPIACLEDVPVSLVGKKIEGHPHSIWEIVEHMNCWMDYEVHRIGGESPVYPEHAIQSWPASEGPASETEWNETLTCFTSLLGQLEVLSNSNLEIMRRQVAASGPSASPSTVEEVLWQMVAHNSYHIGQVVLIRQCLGAWPPRKGGDSW